MSLSPNGQGLDRVRQKHFRRVAMDVIDDERGLNNSKIISGPL